MSDSTLEAQLAAMRAAISEKRTTTYANIAAFAILAYDVLLDMSREYKYIWSAKWSLPKAMYIFSRYYGLVHVGVIAIMATQVGLSVNACKAYLYLSSIAGLIIFTTVINIILLLRLYALYKSSVHVLWFLIIAVFVEFVLELYITVATLVGEQVVPPSPLFPYPGCVFQSTSHHVSDLITWIPTLFISVIFFGMTIRKFMSSAKNRVRPTPRYELDKSFSPLLVAFVRDGTVFFLLYVFIPRNNTDFSALQRIAVVLLVSTIFSIVVKGPLEELPLVWLTAVYSYSATRLIINLREAAVRTHQESTWNETMQLSALEFTDRQHSLAGTTDS